MFAAQAALFRPRPRSSMETSMAFRRLFLAASAIGVLLTVAAWHVAADGPVKADVQPALKLLADGDALADKQDYAAAVLRYKEAYDQLVPELRGKKFLAAVKPQLMTREE